MISDCPAVWALVRIIIELCFAMSCVFLWPGAPQRASPFYALPVHLTVGLLPSPYGRLSPTACNHGSASPVLRHASHVLISLNVPLQILEAIDLPRCERLPRPEACPADFYELILRCWAHDPGDRPTFAQLVTLLPDMQPQCLVAISACADLQPDHLQYSQNDLIIVLDKT